MTTIKDELISFVLSQAVRVVPGIPKAPVQLATTGISNHAMVLTALGKGTCCLEKFSPA